MNHLTDLPLDRENSYHPSLFQSDETWKKACQQSTQETDGNRMCRRPTNPATAALIREFVNSRASCDTARVGQEIPTVLSVAFMGAQNVEILQQGLRRGVFEQSGNLVGRQDDSALIVQMQKVYNTHARNVDEEAMTWEQLKAHTVNEIKRLNCIVYTIVIPIILANVQHYLRYIQEKDSPLPVMADPIYTGGGKDNTLVSRSF